MSERPAKRARGSYAKLICFACRERRIKCQLPQDGSVQPSPDPQPPHTACERCKQQGLDCIVRKTTLGRPSQKQKTFPTPASTTASAEVFKSPSPEAEDLVLLQLDGDKQPESGKDEQVPRVGIRPTSAQLIRGIGKNVDLTSGLLARDPRFGSSIMESRDAKPPSLEHILTTELVQLLDEHLIWQRMYIPWLPRLTSLYEQVQRGSTDKDASTLFLTALLASIALDTPSERLTQDHRELRVKLQSIVYHAGQSVLFTLPKHVNTINALVLIHGYRPLSLIHSHQAAAHTLSGKLYPTLIEAVQRQLSFDEASARLRKALDNRQIEHVPQLIIQALQWCSTLSFKLDQDLEDLESHSDTLDESASQLQLDLVTIAETIDLGIVPSDCIFIFHIIRYHADYILTMWRLTANWDDLPNMTDIIEGYEELCKSRKRQFDRHLNAFFYSKGRAEEGLALAQLSSMELNQGRTNAIGLSMFFAIVYGAQKAGLTTQSDGQRTVQLSKYYTSALLHEAGIGPESKTDVRKFLDLYGDGHMDGLEKRLTDFINVASEVQLEGIPFAGPARHTTSNVLMACKEIVENNAVRIKLDGELHHRADTQLILFQEAARRLEGMEADGGSAQAVARGSLFAASAKLVRSLHRILSQWKRNYITKQQDPLHSDQSPLPRTVPWTYQHSSSTPFNFNSPHLDAVQYEDDFLTDWENWPHLNNAGIPSLFGFDLDNSGL